MRKLTVSVDDFTAAYLESTGNASAWVRQAARCAALAEAGVSVQASRYDGMVHGFFAMSGMLEDGRRAVAEAAEFLRAGFTQ